MKKFLSVALTLTMIVSMLTATVSAATMSDIFTNEWSSTTPVYGDVMLDVAVSAKRSGYTTYSTADLQLSDTNLSSGIGVDYKATLDMLPVTTLSSTMLNRDFVSSALNDDAAETEFYAGTVATNIEVKITYPSAAVVDNVALDAAGIDNSAYVENGSRTFSAEGENTVATINYKQANDSLTINDLINNPGTLFDNINFVINGVLAYNAEGTYNVSVEMSGATTFTFTSGAVATVTYKTNPESHAVSVSTAASSTTGGGAGNGGVVRTPAPSATSTPGATSAPSVTPVEVTVSKEAADNSSETGAAISLPIEPVDVKDNADNAQPISVTLPAETTVKVKIPVANADNGTVAVIVNEDGTTEVIRKTTLHEDGLIVPLDSSETIKIVDNSKTFEDTIGHWGEDYIDYVTSRELFNGTSETTFEPDAFMTRAMITRVLHNYESNPEHSFDGSFADVATGEWYTDSILWAAQHGIVKGYEDGSFGVDGNVTREDFAVILYRYAGAPEHVGAGMGSFTDADNISDYAINALSWAVEKGIISGVSDNTLDPKGEATRAQVATMLQRFVSVQW
ncbi:MAG: S-layer homology domain-containing protein [Ruminococcaceae bacterium]|nr:S-layer homology domain-containing protein [Oscillospiraceae bacterium]